MKITKRQLKRIIKKEHKKLVSEAWVSPQTRREQQAKEAAALVEELASKLDDIIGSLEVKDQSVLRSALYKVQKYNLAGDYRKFSGLSDDLLMSIILQQVLRR